jgi:hypothetical protein
MKFLRAAAILAVLVAGLIAAGAAGLGPLTAVFNQPIYASANGGVVAVDLVPIPEGPMMPNGGPPLASIKPFIPEPLPAPLNNWFCSVGGDLGIVLGNGRQVVYGPCHRPASIDHLWAEIIYLESSGRCAPRCGPGGVVGP